MSFRIATVMTLALVALPAYAQDVRAPAAPVASATAVTGPVQVNQGERFVPLLAGQSLRAGDRIMTLVDGSATLTYPDGCVLTIKPENLRSVPERCNDEVAAQWMAPGNSQAVGSTATTGVAHSSGLAGAAPMIAVVAIGDAILYSQSDENDDETVSP
jgi:hypothetical protein